MKFKPTAYDVEWTRKTLIDSGKNYWVVPNNNALYKIDRQTKTFTLLEGPDMWKHGNLFEQLTAVAACIGWTTARAPKGFVVTREMREEATGNGKISTYLYTR